MSEFRRGRGRGGAVSRPRPVAPTGAAASARDFEDDTEEADEIKDLREKYGGKLSTAKELFPEWTDEDLLFTIGEAHGDLDLAIVRITDGQAEQFHVKAKKEKKVTPAVAQPTFSPGPGRGGFGDRGGRGRGALVAGRGGRGVPRGARGGIVSAATPRAPYANGASNGTTPASFTAPAPTAAAPTWVTPAAAAASSTPAPTGWGDVAAASSVAAQASSEWGAPTETSTTATQGWGDEPAKTNGDAAHDASPEPAVGAGDGWAAPKPKPASKIIAPGAKMSWAQIARPISPPKPAPPPPAPVAAPAPPPVAAPAPSPPAPEPVVEAAAPEPIAESEPVQTSASWNEAPAAPGPLDAWGSAPAASTPAPLGVGEGWADSVVAAPEPEQPYASQVQPEVNAHLPPNDIQTAGPIDVSTPAAVEESIQTIPVAPEPPVEAGQDKIFGAGPPGLSKRASNRPQQEAVVMPSERAQTGLDIGVQFGSLNLFENQPSFGQQDAPPAVQPKPEPSFIQQEAAPAPVPQQYSHEAAHQYSLAQHAQAAQAHHQAQDQGVQTSFAQAPPPNSFAQNNAFANRYPSSQYGAPPQHAEEPSHTPYAPFKQPEASPYFQHPGSAHSHSPAPGQQQPAASYQPFSAPGQAPGFPASQQSDYAGAYGQEALRNMGFYDQYGQAQGGFQQTATPLPRSDDPAAAAAGSPAPVTPQPGQAAPHQQFPGQGQQQYMPQGYGGYGPQYGYQQPYYNQAQYAPNFNALQQQYSQYGQQYGQPQGYGRAPAQYAPQPSNSQQGFRQGQPGGAPQQNQAPNPAAQAYNYGGYPAANAYDPRAIPGGQGQERKADQYSSSKDLDRGFY